ncbi:hypothetical protein HNR44_001169 [Geomicrobium halophilum]|uniref:Uncharacterized protein n=1 Tax=Geomicrobium halophilum TaxID=549000 RepID=A0A841PKB8_9BACL|nr:hypothetical protein [Geomicrobium halophilum]MBB6449220.1 hypothetical protein [Geomicrobium halophilum]
MKKADRSQQEHVEGHVDEVNEKKIKGMICNSGIDFVDVLRDDCSMVTVLKDSIRKIQWLDDLDCDNPCIDDPFKHHDHCHHHHCRFRFHHLLGVDDCLHCEHHDCCCHDHHCGHHFTCLHDHSIPVCDHRIQLRLSGLTDNLNFQFLRKRGCEVIIECSS